MQRLRVRFSRQDPLKFLSHLDLLRLWERAIRRAELPLAYSEGFSPHPRLSFAAPLPVGMTSDAELADIFLSRWIAPQTFAARLRKQLPQGIELNEVQACSLETPPLPATIIAAEYRVVATLSIEESEARAAIHRLLETKTIPWSHLRGAETHSYDLRPLINDIWLERVNGKTLSISMRLRCDTSGSGRPEQVFQALGFQSIPDSIHRTRLITRP
ncbi:MAG: TIGR03936 family radical SAM-associated protein [Chloroflexota bacterium]